MNKKLEENPGLFLLYVQWGIGHLALIDDCIKRLASHSNTNLDDAIIALEEARAKLCEEEVYKVANRMLEGIRNKKGNFRVETNETCEAREERGHE